MPPDVGLDADDDGQYLPGSLASEDLADDAPEDLPEEVDEGIEELDPSDGHRPGMKDGHGEPDDSMPIEAIPEYQEDRPPVVTRAITQEMLAASGPVAEADASIEDEQPHQEPSVQERARSNANAAKTIKMTALPFEELDGMRARPDARTRVHAGAGGAGDDDDAVDVPIEEDEPVPTASARRGPRASTMALSDDDLEELLEPSEVADKGGGVVAARAARSVTSPSALAGAARPSFHHRGEGPSSVNDEDGASDQDDDVAAPAVDAVTEDPEADLQPASGFSSAAEERFEQRDDVDEVADAMDEPERARSEAPVEARGLQ